MPRRPAGSARFRWLPWLLASALACTAIAALAAVILWGVWPGAMVHAAPWACPAGFPDAFVQEHVYSVPGETRLSWSLVCMSAHGAMYQAGMSQILPLAIALLWLPLMALALVLLAGRGIASRGREEPAAAPLD